MISTIIIFIITLLILVVSHEFGHFLAAKKFGIKVLEFGFGLPPKIFGKKLSGTEFTFNWLPIGGFVRLLGEDEVDEKISKEKGSFVSKKVWQRMIVVTAGVIMNFLLAALLFWIVLSAQNYQERIPLLIPYKFAGVEQTEQTIILISNVAPDSPASSANLKQGDQITAINSKEITDELELINITKKEAGKEIQLTVTNTKNQTRQVNITPRANPPSGQGPLGIEMGTLEIAKLHYATLPQKIASGITHSYNLASYSFNLLGRLIATSITTRNLEPVSGSVSGPVGITNLAGSILQTQSPLIPYLNFVALLSLNLAIVNILPFPALDGGRLVFLLIEAIIGKRVKAQVEKMVHTIGMVILIALIIIITYSDIKKFF